MIYEVRDDVQENRRFGGMAKPKGAISDKGRYLEGW
jgi:hypothetical protein